MSNLPPARTLVVDEAVTERNLQRFTQFARTAGISISDTLSVRQKHPGMPDGQILLHLLNDETIFLTSDRPLHNRVLAKGLVSYFIDTKHITNKWLQGIDLPKEVENNKKDIVIKESYIPSLPPIRSLLLPESSQRLKKLNTKRRRIRNHFDGLSHLDQVAVTVSLQPLGSLTLIGVHIQVSSNVGIKALKASESYTAEPLPVSDRALAALSYALVLSVQLLLHSIKTVVYFDSERIDKTVLAAPVEEVRPFQLFLGRVSACFDRLEFIPVAKGAHLELLREKLTQLAILAKTNDTNEIQQANLQEMVSRVAQK